MELKRKTTKKIFLLFILVPIAIWIGMLLMVGVYSFPTETVSKNIQNSLPMYEDNDKYFKYWTNGKFYSQIMTFTDSIMLNTAVCRPAASAINNAMNNAHAVYPNTTEQYQNLTNLVNGEEDYTGENYSRYWHGYLLFLIPALQFMDVGELRVVNMIFQVFLAVALFYYLGKRNTLLAFIYCAIVLFINPVTTILTFQQAIIYYISTITMIIIAKSFEKIENKDGFDFIFILNGISVAFFDFLTYPLVALGLPLVLVLFLNDFGIKKNLIRIVRYSVGWGYGYIGMWFGKWVVGTILTGTNMFADAFETINFRTHGEYQGMVTYSNTLHRIWNIVNDVPMRVLLFCTVAIFIYVLLSKQYKVVFSRQKLINIIPILLVATYPFIWYYIAMNHSVIHPMMSYRELSIFIWAILLSILKLLMPSKMKNKEYQQLYSSIG